MFRNGELIVATVEPRGCWLDDDVERVSYEIDGQVIHSTVVEGHYRVIA